MQMKAGSKGFNFLNHKTWICIFGYVWIRIKRLWFMAIVDPSPPAAAFLLYRLYMTRTTQNASCVVLYALGVSVCVLFCLNLVY